MNRKINLNRPKLSADEIAQRKNFDSVLKAKPTISKPIYKKPWFLSSVIVSTAAIITTAILLNKEPINTSSIPSSQDKTDSIALEKFYQAENSKPCISPPLSGINIPYTTYKVLAEKGGKFDFKTGSTFTIPPNIFRDMNGNQVKGEVEIRYREFHDMVDVFIAGIPMTYDSAENRYHFESAGMLEMLAYQNGKPVSMAKDKSITIEMISSDADPKHNLYVLDTVQNNWACLGKDKIIKDQVNNKKVLVSEIKNVTETTEFKELESKKEQAKSEKENKIATLPKVPAAPKKPEKVNAEKFTFNIEVDPKEFPELSIYKGVLFEVGAENKTFTKAMYETTWDNAIIKDGTKKGENYLLSLQKGNKKNDLIVYPVFEGKNYATALKDFQDKYSKYTSVLEKRQADEKKIETEYAAKVAEYKKRQEELEKKWKAAQDEAFKSLDTEQRVKRMFAINSFGVYNCDNPNAYPKGILCTAELKNDLNKKLHVYDVFLVEKGRNAMFSFTRNPVTNFSFDPSAKNILWTVENGVLYYLKPEDFNTIKNGNGTRGIQLNKVTEKFSNADEMKAFFEI